MNYEENTVFVVKDYDKIDGYNAYKSTKKGLAIGLKETEEKRNTVIALKLLKDKEAKNIASEALELHQALDMTILACKVLGYFQEAYRFPKLYDPDKLCIDRIGLQGGVMPVSVCTDNQNLDTDIQSLSMAVSQQGEMIGERLRMLSRLLKEMGY